MGRLMGSSNSNNYGEQIFINKASEYLDDTNIIYWNRQLFGKEFDVCILMPEKGILVVELKGWREENILRIENNDSVIIQTNDGEVVPLFPPVPGWPSESSSSLDSASLT